MLIHNLYTFAQPIQKHYFQWNDVIRTTAILAEKLKAHGQFKGIIAVSRGGLIPAALLSYFMKIKYVDTICVSGYCDNDKKMDQYHFHKIPQLKDKGQGYIIVDDLADSGDTLKIIHKMYPKALRVTLLVKPKGRAQSDVYVQIMDQNTWVVFPWEQDYDINKTISKTP